MNDDTTAAPTSAAESETTEIPPATHAAPELAWSAADDDTDEPEAEPWPRALRLTLIAIVALIGLAVIGLGTEYFREQTAKPVALPSKPTTSTVAAPPPAAPAPSTVTVTAAPPSAATPVETVPPTAEAPALTEADGQFLATLANMGVPYTDPTVAVAHAHAVCDFMASHRGTSASSQAFVESTTKLSGLQAVEFAEYSRVNYCPQFASE